MTTILASLAFLRGLKPWHFIVAGLVAWSGIVATKAYRLGETRVVAKSEKANKSAAAKAGQAHAAAKAPGAADRLLKDACRDC